MARRRSSGITSLRFNQDHGCFTCCLTSGLRVYNVDPLVEKAHYSLEEVGEISICEMVYRSNWLLLVRAHRPCTMYLLDDHRRRFSSAVTFKSPIRAIRARKEKVAVVLPTSVQVLTLPGLQRLALVRTPQSARPLCALTSYPGALTTLIAAPAHRVGTVQLLDLTRSTRSAQSSSPAVVSCHKASIACICLSSQGTKLATASVRGTLIRIWDTTTKLMLHELRRGSDYADIYCINFNSTGSLVCCVSDKGTVHVWGTGRGGAGQGRGGAGQGRGGAGQGGTHLAAAAARPDVRALCAFAETPGQPAVSEPQLTVICEDGTFHKFTYSAEGSCHRSDFEYFLQVGDDDEFVR